MSTRFLHVANGHATTGLIESSSIPGRTLVWADPLNEGPVPGGISDDALLQLRAGFLAPTPHTVADVVADLRSWRAAVNNHDAYDEVVLWFEHDLFDQLNLIQLLVHLADGAPDRSVTMVCINAYPGHPSFKGLGELEPLDLEALLPARQRIDGPQFALARRAWQAFRSSDPRGLDALLKTDTSALPFLSAALHRHLEELPAEENGLSRSERRLLELAGDGSADLHDVLPRMHEGETAYYITDTSLWDSVQSLARSSPALLTVSAPEIGFRGLANAAIELTPEGRDVLNGSADRVHLCGIDRWFGGVRTTGRGPVWRWSARQGRTLLA